MNQRLKNQLALLGCTILIVTSFGLTTWLLYVSHLMDVGKYQQAVSTFAFRHPMITIFISSFVGSIIAMELNNYAAENDTFDRSSIGFKALFGVNTVLMAINILFNILVLAALMINVLTMAVSLSSDHQYYQAINAYTRQVTVTSHDWEKISNTKYKIKGKTYAVNSSSQVVNNYGKRNRPEIMVKYQKVDRSLPKYLKDAGGYSQHRVWSLTGNTIINQNLLRYHNQDLLRYHAKIIVNN